MTGEEPVALGLCHVMVQCLFRTELQPVMTVLAEKSLVHIHHVALDMFVFSEFSCQSHK